MNSGDLPPYADPEQIMRAGLQGAREVGKAQMEATTANVAACPACKDKIENWWSYCAMCGWRLSTGARPAAFND
jgi:hypothetical protein